MSKFTLSSKKRILKCSTGDLQACGTITMALLVCSGDTFCKSVQYVFSYLFIYFLIKIYNNYFNLYYYVII